MKTKSPFLSGLLLCLSFYSFAQNKPALVKQIQHGQTIEKILFTPDGKNHVTNCLYEEELKVWQGSLLLRTIKQIKVSDFVMSATPNEIVAIASGGLYRISLETGEKQQLVSLYSQRDDKILLGTSSDQAIVSYNKAKKIESWQLSTGNKNWEINFDQPIVDISYAPGGELMVVMENKIAVVRGNQIVKQYGVAEFEVKTMDIHPTKPIIAVAGLDLSFQIKNVLTGETISSFQSPVGNSSYTTEDSKQIRDVFFSQTGDTLISTKSAWGNNLELWDWRNAKRLQLYYGDIKPFAACDFNPNTGELILSSYEDYINVWEITSGKDALQIQNKGYGMAEKESSIWGDMPNFIIDQAQEYIYLYNRGIGAIEKRSVQSGETELTFTIPDGQYVSNLQLLDDDQTLFCSLEYDFWITWNTQTGEKTSESERYEGMWDVKMSYDGSLVLVESDRKGIHVLDRATEEKKAFFPNGDDISVIEFCTDKTNTYLYRVDYHRETKKTDLYRYDLRTNRRDPNFHHNFPFNFTNIQALEIDARNNQPFVVLWGGKLQYFGPTGEITNERKPKVSWIDNQFVHIDEQQKYIYYTGSEGAGAVLDFNTLEVLHQIEAGHSGYILKLSYVDNGKKLISLGKDKQIKLWDTTSIKELLSFMVYQNGGEVTVTPDAHFGGTMGSLQNGIVIVKGMEGRNADTFFNNRFVPHLWEKVYSGVKIPTGDLSQLYNNKPPLVKFTKPVVNLAELTFKGGDATYYTKVNQVTLVYEVKNEGAGVSEILLYQNGKLVDRKTKENIQLVNGKVSYSWTSELQAEKSQFKLKALNNDQTESIPAILNVIYEGVLSGQQTLHVITVGINKYDRPDLQLRFAQKDAFSFGEDLKEHGDGLFREVLVHDLYDQNAGKNAILQELDAISQQAQSQDVFVFFFSGHGTTMENSDSEKSFFLVPYDVMQLKGDYGHLQEKAISDAELLEAFRKIKAKKQWIILDACYSGALVGAMAFKGAAKDEALYHLARTSGTHIFASSGEQQESVEDEQFGHGIFTYYLLQGLAGQANGTNIDEHITVKELMNFTQSSVLKLRRQQRPTAYSSFDDFPIRLLKR